MQTAQPQSYLFPSISRLRRLTVKYASQGLDRLEILRKICDAFDYPYPKFLGTRTNFRLDIFTPDYSRYKSLLKTIDTVLLAFNCEIATWEDGVCCIEFIDERYAIAIGQEVKFWNKLLGRSNKYKFLLLDNFHEKEMQVKTVCLNNLSFCFSKLDFVYVNGTSKTIESPYRVHFLTDNLFFFVDRLDDFEISLCRLDLVKRKFICMDTVEISSWHVKFINDIKDPQCFAIKSYTYGRQNELHFGQVDEDGKLEIDFENKYECPEALYAYRLCGNELSTLMPKDQDLDPIHKVCPIVYGEYSFHPMSSKPHFIELFTVKNRARLGFFSSDTWNQAQWVGDLCYIAMEYRCHAACYKICRFDLEVRKLTVIKCDLTYPCVGLNFNEDNKLTLCTRTEPDKKHSIVRFSERCPDKLVYLAFFATKRNFNIHEKKLQKRLQKKLPTYLQEFGTLPAGPQKKFLSFSF